MTTAHQSLPAFHAQQRAAYRAVCRRTFELIAAGDAADPGECARVLAEGTRLTDDLGPVTARAIRDWEATSWYAARGCCAWCGTEGVHHTAEIRKDHQ
jgi:hypothetical protein